MAEVADDRRGIPNASVSDGSQLPQTTMDTMQTVAAESLGSQNHLTLACEPHAAEEFASLIEPLLPKAYQTALYFTRDPVEAEEVVQDAALHALGGFSRFESGTNFRAWFLKILTNAFYQRCRAAARNRETISLDGVDGLPVEMLDSQAGLHPVADDPAYQFMRRLTDSQVRRAIADLPVKQRVVASLYFLHDLTYADIARIAGCPVGTVRSRLHRARAGLRQALWLKVVDSECGFDEVDQKLPACA